MQKTAAVKTKDGTRTALLAAAGYAAVFFGAMVLANSTVQGVMSPFPAAFVGALPLSYGIPAFLGAMLTYFITSKVTLSVVQIIAMLTILVVKIFVCEILSKYIAARGRALISAACYLCCSLCVSVLTSQGVGGIVVSVLFSSICFASSYTGYTAFVGFFEKRRFDFSGMEGVCTALAFSVVVASLCMGQLFIFNLGRIIAAVAVLCVASRYKTAGGAVCAATGILGLSLYSTDFASASVFILIGGVAAGLLSGNGVIMPALVFFGVNAVGALTLGASSAVGAMADTLAASAIYVLLPERNINSLFGVIASPRDEAEMASARFEFASRTIHDVRRDVEKISAMLDKSVKTADLSTDVCDRVCAVCPGNVSCWEGSFDKTYTSFKEAERKTVLSGGISETELPVGLSSCYRKYELALQFGTSWGKIRAAGSAHRKVKEMRELLFEQFGALEDILADISLESRETREHDAKLSRDVKNLLVGAGAKSPKIFAYTSDGRITVEGYFSGKSSLTSEEISDRLFDMTERDFLPPIYNCADNITGILIAEQPSFSIDFGTAQHAAQEMSGDTAEHFSDGRGNEYTVVSDGMGTGKHAALDSRLTLSMLSRLICAGVGLAPAARIINASMQVKSPFESFATLCVMKFNLYSGETDIIKYGNGVTFVKSGGRVTAYEANSMPLGILASPEPETVSIRLRSGDIAVTVSDGVCESVYAQIKSILMTAEKETAQSLARRIADTAKSSFEGKRADDITAAAVIISKNSCLKLTNK